MRAITRLDQDLSNIIMPSRSVLELYQKTLKEEIAEHIKKLGGSEEMAKQILMQVGSAIAKKTTWTADDSKSFTSRMRQEYPLLENEVVAALAHYSLRCKSGSTSAKSWIRKIVDLSPTADIKNLSFQYKHRYI